MAHDDTGIKVATFRDRLGGVSIKKKKIYVCRFSKRAYDQHHIQLMYRN